MLFSEKASAQSFFIKGIVYDSSRLYPMEAVSVISTSGKGTVTDSRGQYQLKVNDVDSIWFSYLGKPTVKFPVATIRTPHQFDIAIQINVPVLAEVKLRPRNYRQDSLNNRNDYARAFNYKKPGLKTVTPQYGAAAGFDLQELINVFRFKRNRSMAAFQKRLLEQEKQNAIKHRFSKNLVRRLTKLTEPAIDSFMRLYEPDYEYTLSTSDYDFQQYILIAFDWFQHGLPEKSFLRPWQFVRKEEQE